MSGRTTRFLLLDCVRRTRPATASFRAGFDRSGWLVHDDGVAAHILCVAGTIWRIRRTNMPRPKNGKGGVTITIGVREVIAIVSAAFLGLLSLLYFEMKDVEDELNDRIWRVAETLDAKIPNSPQSSSVLSISGEILANAEQACVDSCVRAAQRRYGSVNNERRDWCRRICSGSSSSQSLQGTLAMLD